MDSISRNLDGFSCAILGNQTFIVGNLQITEPFKGYIYADECMITKNGTKVPLIVSRIEPITTVKTMKNSYKGKLIQKTEKTATIELDNGTAITTKYDSIETQPFPSHQFSVDGDTDLNLQLSYIKGLDYEILSHLIKKTESSLIIRQIIKLTNNLPFALTNIENVLISFQKSSSNEVYAERKMAMSARQSVSIESTVDEVGAPISLGPIDVLPAKRTINHHSIKPTIVDIVNTFVDVNLNESQLYSTLELSPKNNVLYPSKVYINDPTYNLPIASFNVPLQLPASIFTTNMGITTSVSVKKKVIDKDLYSITLVSNVDHPTQIRVMGYQLMDRIDIHTLPAKETQTFTGKIPKID